MGVTTRIAWCDSSWNGWWGCQEVSPGCDNCYARVYSERMGRAKWGPPATTTRLITGPDNWKEPVRWNRRVAEGDTRWRKNWVAPVRPNTLRRLVFANSMSDIFEYTEQLDLVRNRLWRLIEETPYLDWILCTKRERQIRRYLPQSWLQNPLPNVWLMVTAENQEWANKRIPWLLEVPAVVHGVSAEPLIGPIDFAWYKWLGPDKVNWVITGGESGANRREMDIGWVRALDTQCRYAGIAHFYKQTSALKPGADCLLDGIEVKNWPITGAPEPPIVERLVSAIESTSSVGARDVSLGRRYPKRGIGEVAA